MYPVHFGMASSKEEKEEYKVWMEPVTHFYSKGMATAKDGAVSKVSRETTLAVFDRATVTWSHLAVDCLANGRFCCAFARIDAYNYSTVGRLGNISRRFGRGPRVFPMDTFYTFAIR